MAALLHPRRGGRPGPRIKIDRSAGAALRERFGVLEASTPLAEQPGADAEMTEAARNYLSGDANLRGAAVVAALPAQATGSYELGKSIATPLADAWVREHGLTFTVRAFAGLSQVCWGGGSPPCRTAARDVPVTRSGRRG